MAETVAKKINIVGCGPGSPEHLTFAAKQVIEKARVLVGAPHLLALYAGPDQETIAVRTDIEDVLNEVAKYVETGFVVILVSGDPGLWSLARPVIRRFGQKNCEVIPGISSVQLAFARLGLDWQDVRIISAHKEIPKVGPEDLAMFKGIMILSGHKNAQSWIGDLALALGREYQIVVFQDLSLETERIQVIAMEEFTKMVLSTRTLVLLLRAC